MDTSYDTETVVLAVDEAFFTAKERWVALIIKDKPYLINRRDCAALQHVDNTIHLNLHTIMNIPEGCNGDDNQEDDQEDDAMELSLTKSSGAGIHLSASSGAVSSTAWIERHNETIIHPLRRKHAILVETPYRLLSLVRHIKEGGIKEEHYRMDHEMSQYLKMVIDYALIGLNFNNNEHRLVLENKLLAHYNNTVTRNDENVMLIEQPHLFFVFLLNVILCETVVLPITTPYFDNTSIRYQYDNQIMPRLTDACVSWELFKLRRNKDNIAIDQYQCLIDEFLELTSSVSPSLVPKPTWTKYVVDSTNPREFWWSTPELFLVRFEWLPSLIADGMHPSLSDRLRNGNLWLSVHEFHDYFLPRLYRNLLIDSFRHIWMCRFAYRDDKFIRSLTLIEQENFNEQIYQHLPPHDARARAIFDYSNDKLGIIQSPITKILNKRDALMPNRGDTLSFGGATQMTSSEAGLLSQEIDIEELNHYLPPCMKPLMKKNTHLGWMDRVTTVSYLADMGYSMQDSIRLLSGCEKNDIKGHYTSQQKRKNDKKYDPTQLHSLCCNAIMSIDGSRGHKIRCPYEEAANGTIRKKKTDYASDEKARYRRQCADSIGSNVARIASPLDYIKKQKEKEMDSQTS